MHVYTDVFTGGQHEHIVTVVIVDCWYEKVKNSIQNQEIPFYMPQPLSNLELWL